MKEKDYIEQYNPVDEIQSAHYELSRSHEYSDENLFSIEQLKEKGRYWLGELQNPLRSTRNKVEVNTLVDLILFELASRHGEVSALESYYQIPSNEAPQTA